MATANNSFQFTDAEFMTAKDKALTLRDWRAFLESGLAERKFSNRLYNHLIQHCSFIAHYNRAGFYAVYFTNDYEATRRFLQQFDTGRSAEMPGDWWQDRDDRLGYRDINAAMMRVAKPYLVKLWSASNRAERDADLAEAERLRRKHGVDKP